MKAFLCLALLPLALAANGRMLRQNEGMMAPPMMAGQAPPEFTVPGLPQEVIAAAPAEEQVFVVGTPAFLAPAPEAEAGLEVVPGAQPTPSAELTAIQQLEQLANPALFTSAPLGSTLAAARAAGLDARLGDASQQFTFFAPTDNAWRLALLSTRSPMTFQQLIEEPGNRPTLDAIMRAHLVGQTLTPSDLTDGRVLQSENPERSIVVRRFGERVFVSRPGSAIAGEIVDSWRVSNGWVYAIDEVLLVPQDAQQGLATALVPAAELEMMAPSTQAPSTQAGAGMQGAGMQGLQSQPTAPIAGQQAGAGMQGGLFPIGSGQP